GETPIERLIRAFRSGETCKPPTPGIRRGEGLDYVLQSCQRLSAYLYVQSAEAGLSADYSSASSQRPAEAAGRLRPHDRPSGCDRGTAITVLWPLLRENPDQEELFRTD